MSGKNNIKYSVVVPVFNGEKTIKELNEELITFFRELGSGFEVIYVDDSSFDNSWKVLNEVYTLFP